MKKDCYGAFRKMNIVSAHSRRIFFILMICLLGMELSAQQTAASSKVTVNAENATINSVLLSIQNQTDMSIVYNVNDIDPERRISIKATDEGLLTVLDRIFEGTAVNHKVMGKYVVLSQKPEDGVPNAVSGRQEAVSGTVRDELGMPTIGATVIVKGTSNGVVVGPDGRFTLPGVKIGDVLEVSLLGYAKQEIAITGYAPQDIIMIDDDKVIEAVVVTALGIRREQKSLTYNVQEVSGELVNTVKDANFVNSLTGKVAGLQINASSSGLGGSTRVIMRGVKSINGNNNALYVIDGIPLPSLRSEQTAGIYETPDGGDFEGIANFNPDDIESMSVLSGATAAALYGSQGANGVILITTKKGREGKLRVNYSNNTTFTSPFVMPRFQNTYGTDDTTPSMSWGEKLSTPSSYDPKDFFQTGFSTTNAVGISVGTERNQTYASAASVNARGIIHNNDFERYNFSIRNTTALVPDNLTLDLGASYMRQYDRNSLVQGIYHNPLIPIYLFPRGDDIGKYQIYERYDATDGYMKQFWPLEFITGVENPFWVTNRQLYENLVHRYSINATLRWEVTDWFDVTGRVRTDVSSMGYTRKLYASTNTLFASENGNYLNHTINHNNVYADVIASFHKTFRDVSLEVNVGASLMDDVNKATGFEGHLANLPNKFTLFNIDMKHPQTKPYQSTYHDQVQAVYGTAQVGYRGMVYLDVTARNEWASMLAFTPNVNIFYPSVGLSAVVSSMTDLSGAGISFLKVRTSYAEVGNAPERYITGTRYPINVGGIISAETSAPASNLTPERTKSFEAGLNAIFLGNSVWTDVTYYNTNTYNQLFLYNAAPSTGYKQAYINAGKVNNWGVEAVAGYRNRWNDFSMSSSVIFSMNRNKILELVPEGTRDVSGNLVDINEVNMDYGGYRMKVAEGGSIGDFYVTGMKTDDHGNIYVDPNSNTVILDPDTWIYGGNTEAKFRLGWNNSFSYKGVNLGFLVDARIGGHGVSATQALMDRWGVSEDSANARENGGVWISDAQQIPDPKTFFGNVGNGTSMLSYYVYSMTNVRLREVTLGYDLPGRWFGDKFQATVSLVGSNLFMFYNKAPFDPESTASTGTYYQGLDYFMQPSVRTLGFSAKIQF